ncbi:MAG TPA: uracil-DNA glycosylase [Nitrosomonas sp.]|nr:uracil-DNA glycosylase [Nitrosomonas sp.]
MNDRRKKILNELGLTPRWKIRADSTLETSVLNDNATGLNELTGDSVDATSENPVYQMSWKQLKLAVSQCTACSLHETRKNTVFGVGDEQADWLFVGEGPGAREDEMGEPFVGQAGKLLDQMLAAIHLKRGDRVYIANIVKCRPPNNRNPAITEISACRPYLSRQIELISPKLIIALGKVAAENLLGRSDSLGSLRGKIHDLSGTPLIVTYHPVYLLRALPEKAKAWKDLCFAKATMQSLK